MKINVYIRNLIFIVLIFFSSLITNAQKVLTLDECYDAAIAANALSGEKAAYAQISAIKEKNIASGWLPSVDLNGSIMYNSDVVDLGPVLGTLPFPGIGDIIKPLPHDQYKITLDINQVLYDGGAIKGAHELEKAELNVNEKQTETDLYKLRQQVNIYFFNLMLLQRQKELLEIYGELITKRAASVNSAILNGVMLRSEGDVLESERINILQQLAENTIKTNSLRKVLADLTGIAIDENTELVLPAINIGMDDEIDRPELDLFDLRKAQLTAGEAISTSKRMPKAFGFATLGYGNPPGSNFFMDEFDTFYIIGAGLKWNIFDWNGSRNEKKVIALQKNIIDNRKKDLTDNLRRQLETKRAEIVNLESLLKSDSIMVELRKKITKAAESQLQNGTITATEYLNVLNSERQSLINSEIHKINLSLARVEYINISGNDPE